MVCLGGSTQDTNPSSQLPRNAFSLSLLEVLILLREKNLWHCWILLAEVCWWVAGWRWFKLAPVPGHNPLTNVVKVRPRNKGRILPFFTHPWGPTWIGTHPEYEPPIKECMGQFSENPLHQRNRRNKHLLMGLNVSKYVTQNLLY